MIKFWFPIVLMAVILPACGGQTAEGKKDSVPVAVLEPKREFTPRGDLVTAYEELPVHSDDQHWMEIYLFTSKDSIIVTEVEKLSKDSQEPPAVYIFMASRAQLDESTIMAEPYKFVREPRGMMKVSVEVKSEQDMVQQWVSDPRSSAKPETITVSGIRVLVKDEAQANEIMEKLKSGF